MSTRKQKDNLKQMFRHGSFRIEKRGDSHYGVAEGFRSKRLMFRGATTVGALAVLQLAAPAASTGDVALPQAQCASSASVAER